MPRRKLPQLELPSFSGLFEEWPSFRDRFEAIIARDSSLSDVDKLHYLRGCLKGEAEQLVRNIPTTSGNFQRVWTLLADNYANARLLLRAVFSTLLALPKMKSESAVDLRRLYHCMLQTVGAWEGIGRPIEKCDLFVHVIIEALDPVSRREWETVVGKSTEPPAYQKLRDFIEVRLRALDALQRADGKTGASTRSGGTGAQAARSHLVCDQPRPSRCSLCQGQHYILSSKDFQRRTPAERRELARTQDLCLNCFGQHRVNACPSNKACAVCGRRHHSSIHEAVAAETASGDGSAAALHVRSHACGEGGSVLLATAKIVARDVCGDLVETRALIDAGSEVSIVSESLAQRLGLPRAAVTTVVFGIGGQRSGAARGRLSVEIAPYFAPSESLRISA
ncbi:uncharacterized protein [Cardiocondyla obscurior]|uniref:uncharacterized protein n=1 Tax=Cardiocondyla obscurior TaxID=286306 RepID=UPI003965644C